MGQKDNTGFKILFGVSLFLMVLSLTMLIVVEDGLLPVMLAACFGSLAVYARMKGHDGEPAGQEQLDLQAAVKTLAAALTDRYVSRIQGLKVQEHLALYGLLQVAVLAVTVQHGAFSEKALAELVGQEPDTFFSRLEATGAMDWRLTWKGTEITVREAAEDPEFRENVVGLLGEIALIVKKCK